MLKQHDTAVLVCPIAKSLPAIEDCDWIGIDAGCLILENAGITPLFAIGDFDSAPVGDDKPYPVYRHPVAKNETDSELALLKAREMGYSRIILWGALSGRLDHTLANIRCMLWKVPQAIAMDENHRVRVFEEGCYSMVSDYPHISFFAAEDTIITLRDFDYPLESTLITTHDFYTCSNSISKDEATVIIEKGRVLCVETRCR